MFLRVEGTLSILWGIAGFPGSCVSVSIPSRAGWGRQWRTRIFKGGSTTWNRPIAPYLFQILHQFQNPESPGNWECLCGFVGNPFDGKT